MIGSFRMPSQSLRWITWSTLGLGTLGIGQFVLQAVVLGRFVDAAQWGIVTAASIMIGVCRVVHASIGPALVQREDLRPEHVRSAYAIGVWSAVVMVALLWFAAPLVADFFRASELTPVMRALSLLFLCQAPGIAPEALLQRDMNMRALAMAEMSGILLAYLPLGVGGALLGFGVWSLVAATLGQALLKSIVFVTARPHERGLWPAWGATRDILAFSGGAVAAGLCTFAATQGDNVVVGRSMHATQLGNYTRAYQLMAMPAMFLGEVVDRIVFPLMARFQDDRERLCTAYGRGVSLVVTVMTPVATTGIVLAPEIVRLVLGAGWDDVVPPFQVLMGGLVFRTGYKLSDLLARATGTVYSRAWRQAIYAALILGGAAIGTQWGVTGVAAGVVGALGVNYLSMAWLSIATTGMSWARFGALHLRGIVSGCACGALVLLLSMALREAELGPALTLGGALAGALATTAVAVALAPRTILGGDGMWLWSTLTGRTSG
jgi:PST family polysaccharide transporter